MRIIVYELTLAYIEEDDYIDVFEVSIETLPS